MSNTLKAIRDYAEREAARLGFELRKDGATMVSLHDKATGAFVMGPFTRHEAVMLWLSGYDRGRIDAAIDSAKA